VDREVVLQKLESLRRCVQRVQTKCPVDSAELARDVDLQDIVTLNLSRAIQLCVDIGAHLLSTRGESVPATMGQTFEALGQEQVLPLDLASRLKRAVGFRNIVVHNYEAMDWEVVHILARRQLDDFTQFANYVVAQMADFDSAA
jgi:uncharacterized protein YutE (UPF0331/DUF86 family)